MNFTPIDPVKALYWSAVINGVLAAPVMIMLMLLARKASVMGRFAVGGILNALGWISTGAMALSVLGLAVSMMS